MTLKTRRILFYTLVALFLIIGLILVFYSNGWRFDFETFKINKLGAVFFESIPTDTTIIFNKEQLEFKSAFARSSILIANLFPKDYAFKISKKDYQPWMKELEIKPSLVIEIPPIILLPEKIKLGDPIIKNIKDFWVGPESAIALNNNGKLEFKSQEMLGNKIIRWSEDGNAVISSNNAAYFAVNLDKPNSALNINLIFNNLRKTIKDYSAIQDINFSPTDNNKFVILTGNGLYLLDGKKLAVAALHAKPTQKFAVYGNDLVFASENKILNYNLALDSKEILMPQKTGAIKDIKISPSGYLVTILEENGELSVFDRKSLATEIISQNTSSVLFSPDGKKIAFITNDKNLSVYYIAENPISIDKNKTASFNLGAIDETQLAWHKNSAYLFVKYPSSVYLLEANNIPPINFQSIDFENIKYQYQPNSDSVYLLKENNLYRIELK